jgi:hypothetical protein
LNRVASAKALEKLLREHPVFERYELFLPPVTARKDEDDPILNLKSLDKVKGGDKGARQDDNPFRGATHHGRYRSGMDRPL